MGAASALASPTPNWFEIRQAPRAVPSVVHRMEDEEEEPAMTKPEVEQPKKKRGRPRKNVEMPRKGRAKVAAPSATTPRFGVFEDGSVQISTAECSGRMSGEDAAALVEFIGRLKAPR